MPKFYAAEYAYGANVVDSRDGAPIAAYYWFATAADRDAWVADRRTEYITQAGYRAPVATANRWLRAALKVEGGVEDWGCQGNYRDLKRQDAELLDAYEVA